MAYIPESLENLTNQFAKLPGIGRKSAMRFAYQVLAMDKADAENFANAIVQVHNQVTRCKVCQIFSDTEICPICANENRDKSIICVVEKPRDVNAFEKTREYKGVYHILHGLINPMEGITTDNLCIKELLARLTDDTVKEVIMATCPTTEGETTAIYISKLLKPLGIKVSRIAYGLPVGAVLEYADEVTLNKALQGRLEI